MHPHRTRLWSNYRLLVAAWVDGVAERYRDGVGEEGDKPLRLGNRESLRKPAVEDQLDLLVMVAAGVGLHERYLPAADNDVMVAEWAWELDVEAHSGGQIASTPVRSSRGSIMYLGKVRRIAKHVYTERLQPGIGQAGCGRSSLTLYHLLPSSAVRAHSAGGARDAADCGSSQGF
jgi:hypothetical protein